MVAEHVFAEIGDARLENSCLTILSDEQRIGLTFVILCSFCSLLAVLMTVALYIKSVMRAVHSSGARAFLKTDIDAYFLSLLFADMLVALGGIFNLKWVMQGRTSCGVFCSAQGGLQTLGTPAVALSTLAIALHTFFVIFFRWTPPPTRVIGLSALIGIWTFLILLVLIPSLSLSSGPSSTPFYTPAPAWCYIGSEHIALRAGAGYAFAWLAAVGSGVVYGLLFLRLRGALIGTWEGRGLCGSLSISIRWDRCWGTGYIGGSNGGDRELRGGESRERARTEDGESEAVRSLSLREARKMLWYPLCYIVIILPLSATRWTSFSAHSTDSSTRHEVPFRLTAAAASLFKLGGLVDVLLFSFTRPNILFFGVTQGEIGMHGDPGRRRLGRLGSGRSARSWLDGRTRGRESGSDDGAGDDERGFGMEMRRMERSYVEEESDVVRVINGAGQGGGSQSRFIAPAGISTDVDPPIHNLARSASPDVAPHGQSQRQQPMLDLADELDYYASPVSPSMSVLGSSSQVGSLRGQSSGDRDRRSGSVHSFSPLVLKLPSPRLSGLSNIVNLGSSPWVEMQREEHLAISEPASATSFSSSSRLFQPSEVLDSPAVDSRRSFDGGKVEIHGERGAERISGNVNVLNMSKTSMDVFQQSRAEPARVHRLRTSDGDKARPELELGCETSPGDTPLSSMASEHPLDIFSLEEDPFRASSPSQQSITDPLLSRNRRPRGPRPPPSRTSHTLPTTGSSRARPMRPTIGIPSSSSFASSPSAVRANNISPSPSSQSSVRSPRMRYPQSALASIPEHRLLNHFPSSNSHSPFSLSPTPPLSLHSNRPNSRPRSLSDGASRRPRGRRKDGAREGEGGRRSGHSSFMDMD